MSQEQVMEQLKLLLPAIGSILTMLGIMTPAEYASWATAILGAIGPMFILGGMIWGVVDKTRASLIRKVDVIAKDPTSAVLGIVTTNNAEGRDLSASMDGNTTVTAGTPAAASMARAA
jgi:hypothetical protein